MLNRLNLIFMNHESENNFNQYADISWAIV